jgi:hypothetical protein
MNLTSFRAILYISILTFICLTKTHASSITTRVDPPEVYPGQPFHLILELDENAPSGLPDFNPLSHDFQIHGTAHQASYVYSNGQSKASTRWTVTLIPKQTGRLTIPGIQIGRAQSPPTHILVTTRPQAHHASTQHTPDTALFIKNTLNTNKPYINQQVLYTVKIYHNTSILDASYQPPSLGDALILPLGENHQSEVIEHGRPYLIEEQNYAFFPQKSGTQLIFPPRFQALIYDDVPRRTAAAGTSQSLDVQAIPEGFSSSTWLPAHAISLTEHYDKSNLTLDEGSTLTRTIMIKTTGLPAELIPAFDFPKNDAFNQYPEPPTLNTTVQGNSVLGSATYKIRYLFNQAGDITIPEHTIRWFNTHTLKTMHATLPAYTLHINARSSKPSVSTSKPTPQIIPTPPHTSSTLTQTTPITHALLKHASMVGVLLIFAMFYLLIRKKNQRKQAIRHRALKSIKRACHANQPKAAQHAVLAWARLIWPNASILNLDDVARLTRNTALKTELNQLARALYHKNSGTHAWQGAALWKAIKKPCMKKNASKKQPSSHLPPINPQ